jgi:hypothetical protein
VLLSFSNGFILRSGLRGAAQSARAVEMTSISALMACEKITRRKELLFLFQVAEQQPRGHQPGGPEAEAGAGEYVNQMANVPAYNIYQ